MKVTQEKEFSPITVVLENEGEARAVLFAIGRASTEGRGYKSPVYILWDKLRKIMGVEG